MNEKILATLEYDKILKLLTAHAATSLGKEKVKALQPITDFASVKRILQATDEAFQVERLKGTPPFGGIRDIRNGLQRVRIGGVLNAGELQEIATTVYGGRQLKRFLMQVHKDRPVEQIAALCEEIAECKPLEDEINRCIDEQGHIVDQASSELARIRHELKVGENRVRERLEQMLRTASIQKMLQNS